MLSNIAPGDVARATEHCDVMGSAPQTTALYDQNNCVGIKAGCVLLVESRLAKRL